MTNIFDSLATYGASYSVDDKRDFTEAEKTCVKSAHVVLSQYGFSVCFFMNSGCQKYIPVSRDSAVTDGQVVDLDKAQLITLSKDGEDPITRIEL